MREGAGGRLRGGIEGGRMRSGIGGGKQGEKEREGRETRAIEHTIRDVEMVQEWTSSMSENYSILKQ